MNSKSGLYPLYLAYSLYALKLPKPESQIPLEETQRLWRETLDENIFVLCKTKMAVSITRRTLAGYHNDWTVHAVYLSKLLERMEDIDKKSITKNADVIDAEKVFIPKGYGAGEKRKKSWNGLTALRILMLLCEEVNPCPLQSSDRT